MMMHPMSTLLEIVKNDLLTPDSFLKSLVMHLFIVIYY